MASISPLPTTSRPLASDLEIARQAQLKPIAEIAERLGLPPGIIEPYGHHVGKIPLEAIQGQASRPKAKYIVVSAITPTPLGEGKTTTSVGLAQGFHHIGKTATVALRQPSMGPTFGIKGGAAGGGWSQVVPMERINLHLTGDIHAVTSAHNLLSAMVDNHVYHGNASGMDLNQVAWRRVVDINDRGLRHIVTGLGGKLNGLPRETGFDITAASEVMAVLALADSLEDLRRRLGRIVVGWTPGGEPVTADDIGCAGAMAVMLKEAMKPNLMQTIENTPVLIHAGPFGNIAHGNSSIVADQIGIHGSDYLVTEAGFGADMGAERFFNIKCRASGMQPDAAVLVATVRGLKVHSGRHRVVAGKPLPDSMLTENPDDVRLGASNLRKQIENLRLHGVPVVVAINAFPSDFDSEHAVITEVAREMGARVEICTHVKDGGAGAAVLAQAVVDAAEEPSQFEMLYPNELSLTDKIETIAQRVYGADAIDCSPVAKRQLAHFTAQGFGHLPVCVAKTHLSLSSDAGLPGAPTGWRMPVREVRLSAGAGFVYALCGDIRTMPGLGANPAAAAMDINEMGEIEGLF